MATVTTEQLAKVIADAINAHGRQHNDDSPTLEASMLRMPGVVNVVAPDGHWQVTVERLRA